MEQTESLETSIIDTFCESHKVKKYPITTLGAIVGIHNEYWSNGFLGLDKLNPAVRWAFRLGNKACFTNFNYQPEDYEIVRALDLLFGHISDEKKEAVNKYVSYRDKLLKLTIRLDQLNKQLNLDFTKREIEGVLTQAIETINLLPYSFDVYEDCIKKMIRLLPMIVDILAHYENKDKNLTSSVLTTAIYSKEGFSNVEMENHLSAMFDGAIDEFYGKGIKKPIKKIGLIMVLDYDSDFDVPPTSSSKLIDV